MTSLRLWNSPREAVKAADEVGRVKLDADANDVLVCAEALQAAHGPTPPAYAAMSAPPPAWRWRPYAPAAAISWRDTNRQEAQ